MNQIKNINSLIISLVVLMCLTGPSISNAGMMDFGDIGGGDSGEGSCVVDANPVITPGSFGSPLRILTIDADNYLVADYVRKTVFIVDENGIPSPFIEAEGKVLSVAARLPTRPGRVSSYFVGDDDSRTINVYRVARDGSMRKKKLLRSRHGDIQALDMVYDPGSRTLIVVDGLSSTVKIISMRGRVVRLVGKGLLDDPKGLAFDAVSDEFFVSDYGNPKADVDASIKVFSNSGSLLKTITGAFSRPQGIAVTTDKIYVVDAMLAQVLEFDRVDGALTATYGCMGSSDGHMLLPMDVVLDSTGQNLHVVDNRNMRITVLPLIAGP